MNEVIDLVDEDGCVETGSIFIRGHVTEDEASAIFIDWYEANFNDDPPEMGPWKHRWARWSTEANGVRLRTYIEQGRGRFPVTCATES